MQFNSGNRLLEAVTHFSRQDADRVGGVPNALEFRESNGRKVPPPGLDSAEVAARKLARAQRVCSVPSKHFYEGDRARQGGFGKSLT